MRVNDNRPLSRGRKWVLAAALVGCQLLFAGEGGATCHSVNVPPLNAAEAIERLARQTGAKILFPYDLARGRQARPVAGCMSVSEAMAIMLEGSGLVGLQSENGAFTIVESGRHDKPR